MKFKYMVRGLGLGIIITAAVMGAYNRNAVADARVAVLKEYGLGEESRLAGETEDSSENLSEASTGSEMTEPVIVRDDEKESEINSVLDAAKEAEREGMTQPEETEELSSAVDPSGSESADVAASDTENSDVRASESSPAIVVTPSDEEGAAGDAVEIAIVSGDDSGTVARKLYNAGLIENASEYDAFLMQHGYDKKLSTGTKMIGLTDSWQEIAEKITSK